MIADLPDTVISRKHLFIEPCADGMIRVANGSSKNSLVFQGGFRIGPGEERRLELPIACELGNKVVQVYAILREGLHLQTLAQATCASCQSTRGTTAAMGLVQSLASGEKAHVDEGDLLNWLQAAATSVSHCRGTARPDLVLSIAPRTGSAGHWPAFRRKGSATARRRSARRARPASGGSAPRNVEPVPVGPIVPGRSSVRGEFYGSWWAWSSRQSSERNQWGRSNGLLYQLYHRLCALRKIFLFSAKNVC
ncbi:MAG: hypothetical protein FJ295_21185 [Planctomycetes bacterium]|nr:hypothetical protein [Planctomycetota bacterium]